MQRLFLIDGHSLIFRMYYAFMRRPMVNSKGEDTSILYGFTKYLLELINKEHPTHIAVAFDPPTKTFRHEIYPEYKANRSAAPELVKAAVEPLKQIVEALGIPVIIKNGFEADDVIGTLAKREQKKGFEVYMVTPDKDFGQIIAPDIYQFKPGKSGAENEVVGVEQICSQYGIDDPRQVIDILAIWGDAADNVQGVKGIGAVGAKKLVGRYKSLDNILAHLDELPQKQQAAFEEAMPHLEMSKYLVTIKTDVDIELDESALEVSMACTQCVSDLFNKYEFNSLRKLIPAGGVVSSPELAEVHIELHPEEVSQERLLAELYKVDGNGKSVAFRTCKDIILSCGEKYAHFGWDNDNARQILEDDSVEKIGHATKPSVLALRDKGIAVNGELYDIELMHYILNPERSHKIDTIAKGYLNVDLTALQVEKEQEPKMLDLFSTPVPEDETRTSQKNASECIAAGLVFPLMMKELEEQHLTALYRKIEMPLVEVLADMEYTGVKVDSAQLAEYSKLLSEQLVRIEAEAREMADDQTLNLSSPRQIGIVLYEKLDLDPKAKKNKRENYPTDEETLLYLADRHPIINKILEYRGVKKLLSTYILPLPSLINPKTGKVHTTFNQALTSTGRLSSVRPNLQNIPVRTEQGREIRKAFIASTKDGYIVSADYSQIELRIMAELSQDPGMLDGFRHGADIHTATASRIFGVPMEEVSREQRRKAKVANFGIIYGISAFGLAQRMNISRKESKEFIEEYFKHYPKVKEYMDGAVLKAKEKSYVETIFGRKRYLPDINSRNQVVRGLAERNAINAPIQGSAADIIKLAMINVYNRLNSDNLKSKMVLQVHDELVFDVVAPELERVMQIVQYEMENVTKLSIPLSVECSYGKNWLEAH
ncbi:MAG: DNA polymerase I [Bacteroidales bacterium]|nr:DNA polymerase I [Bacteroidales bacterium]MDD3201053.1 DNA polymerase I [Bacteroidales bacterium]